MLCFSLICSGKLCNDQCCFRDPAKSRSFIPEDHSRLQTDLAESRMGEEEASLNNKQKKKIQVKECDIDNGDGTVDHIK